jgi:acyl dehydratase
MIPNEYTPIRYWEDVQQGERLPSVTFPVTVTLCVIDAASTRDFFPGHHDRDFARGQGVRDTYLNTMFLHGFVDRLGSDWAGPDAWLLRRRLSMISSICAGDIIESEAEVVAKYQEGDRYYVDVNIRLVTQHGLSARAALTYLFPSRASGTARVGA